MRALLPVVLLCASPALADRPAKPMSPEMRIKELERRVADLERQLSEAKAQLAPTPAPPPVPTRVGLDRAKVYDVPLDDSPAIGPTVAPVTIVAAVQFPEPYTHRAWPVLLQLVKENRDVRVVFKNFIVHPKHGRSSIAACAAGMQGEIAAFEDLLYTAASQQQDPNNYGLREVLDGEAREIARSLRVDLKTYDRDLKVCEAGQKRDMAMLSKLGQVAVPVFWINGRPLQGAMPIEQFREVIDEERAKWAAAKKAGAKLGTYYKQLTLEKKTNPY